MDIHSLLPSARFTLTVISIALAVGLVVAADAYTRQEAQSDALAVAPQTHTVINTNWEATLQEIQERSGISLPSAPDSDAYGALLEGARSENLTQSVARSLLVNLSYVGAQGLGSDIPTQERLMAQALSFLESAGNTPSYTLSDLTMTGNSKEELRAWGNAVMLVLFSHPQASMHTTFVALGSAVDYDDVTYFEELRPIEAAYRSLARSLAATPVPKTLSPLHLALTNNFARMADAFPDMRALPQDSLRGLSGLNTYQALADETGRLFTTLAQQLRSNAILFTDEEPGSAWSVFLP